VQRPGGGRMQAFLFAVLDGRVEDWRQAP
jgi:hypothetical protein